MNSEDLIDQFKLADHLGVSVGWVLWRAKRGKIPGVRDGATWLFDLEGVKAVLRRKMSIKLKESRTFEPVELASFGEAAKHVLGGRKILQQLVDAGRVPHFRRGSQLLFDVDVVGAISFRRGIELFRPSGWEKM